MSKSILFLFFIIFQTTNAQYSGFSLEGKTVDIKDGTYLYFRDLVNGGSLDSAVVKDNSFRFDTELPEPAVYVMLHTKDQKTFTEVWLENNSMFFEAFDGDFNKAKITGSKNHLLFKELIEHVRADYMKVDAAILRQRERDFIKNNPEALVSAYILFANDLWTKNEIGEFFSSLSEEVQNSSLGQKKVANYLNTDLPEQGENYLDFNILDSKGEKRKISDLSGKVTLLQFWSSNCRPSRKINESLVDIYKKYHPKGFEIISISQDSDKRNWLQAIKEDKLSWPQLSNLQGWNGEVFNAYGVYVTPSNFLVNSQGIIVERNLRGDEIEKKIREHLEK